MSDETRNDVRRLLKTFGIAADEALAAHITRNPGGSPLRVRLILEDLTDYGDSSPDEPLHVEIEGAISR